MTRNWFAAALLLLLASCGGPPPPGVLNLTIVGSADQNPDANGHGTTVAVQLYQLTATGKFQSTDVYSLMSQEATVLGADEAGASQQILLSPGQTVTQQISLKPNVTSAGVAVLFRQINQSTWRQVAPVAASGPTNLTLTISGLKATLGKTGG